MHGDKPYARMEARHVRRLRDEKYDNPEAANSLLKALRHIFGWACDPTVNLLERNPVRDVQYFKRQSEGWHTWTVAELQRFLDHHGPELKAGRALTFLLYTGVARSDVVVLGRQHCRDGRLVFKRQKTGVEIDIPVLPALEAAINATPREQLCFIVAEFGRPFSPGGFGNKMRDWCNKPVCHIAQLTGCAKREQRSLQTTVRRRTSSWRSLAGRA